MRTDTIRSSLANAKQVGTKNKWAGAQKQKNNKDKPKRQKAKSTTGKMGKRGSESKNKTGRMLQNRNLSVSRGKRKQDRKIVQLWIQNNVSKQTKYEMHPHKGRQVSKKLF